MRKVFVSIVGILLAMFAGGLLFAYLDAEDSGWLSIPWLEIHNDRWSNYENNKIENIWLMVCFRYIPYWQTTAKDAYEGGYLRGSCNSLKTLWSAKN